MHAWLSLALDLLAPVTCASCAAAGAWVCPRCVGETRARRVLRDSRQVVIAADPPPRPLVRALYAVKYQGASAAVGTIAAPLARLVAEEAGSSDGIALVPVPTDARRARKRGYDQAVLLAADVAASLEIPMWNGLVRARKTRDQVGLGKEERRENLAGAFRLAEPPPKERVILLDDVCTTGATLASAEEALRAAGVHVLFLAAVLGATSGMPPR